MVSLRERKFMIAVVQACFGAGERLRSTTQKNTADVEPENPPKAGFRIRLPPARGFPERAKESCHGS